jgi:hypothetical protein
VSCPYWVMGVVMICGCWGDTFGLLRLRDWYRDWLKVRSEFPNCGAKFQGCGLVGRKKLSKMLYNILRYQLAKPSAGLSLILIFL